VDKTGALQAESSIGGDKRKQRKTQEIRIKRLKSIRLKDKKILEELRGNKS